MHIECTAIYLRIHLSYRGKVLHKMVTFSKHFSSETHINSGDVVPPITRGIIYVMRIVYSNGNCNLTVPRARKSALALLN